MARLPDPVPAVRTRRFRFSAKLRHVIFPLREFALVGRALRDDGFTVGRVAAETLAAVEIGPAIFQALYAGTVFDVNPDTQTIGVSGADVEGTLQTFTKAEHALQSMLQFRLEKVHFYEVIADMFVDTDKNPLVVMDEAFRGFPLQKELDETMGESVSLFTLRVIPRARPPDNEDWFELRIEPHVSQATQRYFVGIVFRSQSREKTERFARDLQGKILGIVRTIERRPNQTT